MASERSKENRWGQSHRVHLVRPSAPVLEHPAAAYLSLKHRNLTWLIEPSFLFYHERDTRCEAVY